MARPPFTRAQRLALGAVLAVLAGSARAGAAAPAPAGAAGPAAAQPGPSGAAATPAPAQASPNRLVRDGVVIDYSIDAGGASAGLLEGEYADVRFRITDAASGNPVQGLNPAAWVDVAGGLSGGAGGQVECKEKVSLYLRGLVGIRPVADLNSYFLLVMNGDASISVIDPVVSMTGRTSLYATVLFPRPAADWTRTRNDKRLYLSMPLAGQVAVVDTETFKLAGTIDAGAAPTRIALQPDERYLWVGNDSRKPGEGGVTVIDPAASKKVASIPTGRGHHEIAFSGDSRLAFVTNREDGTVTAIDVAGLKKVKDLRIGGAPISMAFSKLSGALYVADGKEGKIAVVDPATLSVATRIPAKPGLGPMRFTEDGRWGFVVNSSEHAVHVVDAGRNKVLHTVPVNGKPYQVTITRAFAHVRHLDTETVSMVNLLSLGEGKTPIVNGYSAGVGAPRAAGDLSMADAIAQASADAAVFVNNPVEGKTYFYMEGMNAPMGSFSNYGHRTVAVSVVDRSIREASPGTYVGSLRLPEAGRYDVAFLLDNPKVLHCFPAEVKENPRFSSADAATAVEYLDLPSAADAGSTVRLRVKVTQVRGHAPRTGVKDVQVTWYQAPGALRSAVLLRETGEGVYEGDLSFSEPGAWYVQVTVPSLKVGPAEVSHRSVIVRARKPAAAVNASGR
ncbi:MAG TPA: cytochrome D1 domain-containing protein [Anaeromyxobacter sp.]|nr:cytochrome D1 domain-containing protein [Anaeromyxobacter sp.]